jgi:hypothetical protein
MKMDARGFELFAETLYERFDGRAGDFQPKVAQPHLKDFLIGQRFPVRGF